MSDKETLFQYRWDQAIETLNEAKRMVDLEFSPRSIINRSYYAMFYAVLSLFLRDNITINTSKHVGIISVFDREFVQKKKFDKNMSLMLHQAFDDRQEFDYKEQVVPSRAAALDIAEKTARFIELIKEYFALTKS